MKGDPMILCVDDEPAVLEGLKMNLRRRFDVLTAPGGAAALDLLAREEGIAAVMSDMRMPGMDGATLLGKIRAGWPAVTRLLLTGQSDMNAAISAVNDGQIFRFLTKPCSPPALLAALHAAVEQHRLLSAERVLLEQTLHGSIKVLVDVLSLTNPSAFGRATRVKKLSAAMCLSLGVKDSWQVEVAAMLSELGSIALPAETIDRLHTGQTLDAGEQAMVTRATDMTQQLLANIPRLEGVREILKTSQKTTHSLLAAEMPVAERAVVEIGGQVLRLALDMDALEAQGQPPATCIDLLKSRIDRYDPTVLGALDRLQGGTGPRDEFREVTIASLKVGMVFVKDVKLASGTLLVARGYEVTLGFLERLRNFRADSVVEPLRVMVPAPKVTSGSLAA